MCENILYKTAFIRVSAKKWTPLRKTNERQILNIFKSPRQNRKVTKQRLIFIDVDCVSSDIGHWTPEIQ
jgi:hypothetical protein